MVDIDEVRQRYADATCREPEYEDTVMCMADVPNLIAEIEQMRQDNALLRAQIKGLIPENVQIREELQVTNKILAERERLLRAIPECPEHGACVPHAIEWVEQMKKLRASLSSPPTDA